MIKKRGGHIADKTWKAIARLIQGLHTTDMKQAKRALSSLHQMTGESPYHPTQRRSKDAYRYWFNLIVNGFHLRDIEFIRYSVGGMRLVIEESLRKDSLWLRQQKKAA